MRERWLNNGEPDENGDLVVVIENNAGNRVSTFKGKTEREVIDQLLRSQVQANRQIGRLMKPDEGKKPQSLQREFTPTDKLRLATDISDPSKVVDVIEEIVTAKQGVTPAQAGQQLSQQEIDRYYREEANAFVAATPDYYPIDRNRIKLFEELEARNYDLTRNNLAIVFNDLTERDELVPWPQSAAEPETEPEEEPEPEPPRRPPPVEQPVPVARTNYSSTLRASDSSASRPQPMKRPIVTRDMLSRMSRLELAEKLRDPVFRRAVDALPAQG